MIEEASGSGAGPAAAEAPDEQQQRHGHEEAEAVPRDPLGRWLQGHSGNPYGRPPVLQNVRALARAHTALAVEVLASIARDGTAPPGARIVAARELLDRGHGRASPLALAGDLATMSDAELDEVEREEREAAMLEQPQHDGPDLPPDLGGSGASLLAHLSDEALEGLADEP